MSKLFFTPLWVALYGALSSHAFAFPLGSASDLLGTAPQIAPALEGQVDFTAIVALSNCSGSLIRFEGSLESDAALVLTNGHCLKSLVPKPGEVKVGVATFRRMKLLSADGHTLGHLVANRLRYGTMTKTDIGVYELTQTYGEIEKKFGVKALLVSSKHPGAGMPIAVDSGYWRKIYRCTIDRFIPELREDGYVMKDSIRYSQPGCEIIGGTSGSPVIDIQTGEIVGINNTANERGKFCALDNPCEVDASGKISVNKGAAYAQEVYWLYGCLDPSHQFDLTLPSCELPRP